MTITPEQRAWQRQLPTIIMLTGLMGSGKDHVGKLLVEQAGFKRIAFADALKEQVCEQYGITLDELTARKGEFRPILQNWGVSRRDNDPDYWVKEWWLRAQAAINLDDRPVVCTDCRFLNEAWFGLQIHALVARVIVPEDLRLRRLIARDGSFDPACLNHESERYIPTLPVQMDMPGDLPSEAILPFLAESYRTLLYEVMP